MSRKIVPFDVAKQARLDREIWGKRVRYVPARVLAEEYKVSIDDIHDSIARMSAGISPELKDEMRKLELDRCDELLSFWWEKAKNEYEGLLAWEKITHMRARLTGMLQSPSADSSFDERIKNREKSTAAYERQLELLVGKPISEATVIEGEARVVEDVESGKS